jgi:ribosome biogenesis GTPase
VDRGGCDVATADGRVRATAITPVCTGDWVALDEAVVVAVLPRRSAFTRATAGGQARSQVLAANIDLAFIVHPLTSVPRLTRIERLVALAWASGAQPVVLLSKADVAGDAADLVAEVAAAAPGVEVLAVSARTGEGIDALRAMIAPAKHPARSIVFLGVSGAGKSSLANALVGEERLAVRAIRDDGKGRHTSTARELLVIPGGGVVIDTPGLRAIGLWDAEDGIRQAFADVEELAGGCRFNDCRHDGEPGCAVTEALSNGQLSERRLESHRKLQREQAWIAARTDRRAKAERTRYWKSITKTARRAQQERFR